MAAELAPPLRGGRASLVKYLLAIVCIQPGMKDFKAMINITTYFDATSFGTIVDKLA